MEILGCEGDEVIIDQGFKRQVQDLLKISEHEGSLIIQKYDAIWHSFINLKLGGSV